MNGEPTMDQIDDYNNNESPEKRRLVRLVIFGILAVGVVYAGFKFSYSNVEDYVGTQQRPGINTAKQ
ncbi:MAG: hypothetical protein U9N30_04080 [Campylobacterota bacterium]|nr:hypothetical protein [Campylobacterota bacterium]